MCQLSTEKNHCLESAQCAFLDRSKILVLSDVIKIIFFQILARSRHSYIFLARQKHYVEEEEETVTS